MEKPLMLKSARFKAAWVSGLLMLMRAVTRTRIAPLRSGVLTVSGNGRMLTDPFWEANP
jgi:hypothetical protein